MRPPAPPGGRRATAPRDPVQRLPESGQEVGDLLSLVPTRSAKRERNRTGSGQQRDPVNAETHTLSATSKWRGRLCVPEVTSAASPQEGLNSVCSPCTRGRAGTVTPAQLQVTDTSEQSCDSWS